MIKSVWKPKRKDSKISYYELVDREILLNKKGTTEYKVIWVCDNINCKTPTKTHSISACHLVKEKMSYNLQICRSCQCTGNGNGRYGDQRKWSDFFNEEKLNKMKKLYSDKWRGELNPSKLELVKLKKNQNIINTSFIENMCESKGFELIDMIKLDGKKSKFKIKCYYGHYSEKTYSAFNRVGQKWVCTQCYYNSISLTDESEILEYKKYLKKVRALSAKTYKLYKSLINPNDLKFNVKGYHLDHKFSIYDGFKNNINPNIIASKENLEILTSNDNLKKGSKSSITLEELLHKTKYLL